MAVTADHLRRIVAVAHAKSTGFVALTRLAELEPAVAFRGGLLKGDALTGEVLDGFDFTGATFDCCDLRYTDLSGAVGLTAAQLASCRIDETTRLPHALFWFRRPKPIWADSVGTDPYGPWADFRVPGTEVIQRMRLIPAGRFLMGSPGDEKGRWDDEGPQQAINIRQPFWLFDTPCTQQLWQAVMGKNPSAFPGPLRPVEKVSFGDVTEFMDTLNGKIAGLNLVLPTEAQWERACRAGTTTLRYAEPLDNIAWYYGNSERQTHPVKQRDPNFWGLHDMLGNVWEWCEDVWSATLDGTPADGSARPGDGAAARVVRGGSWDYVVQYVRSAVRDHYDPSDRLNGVGFRCARVQNQQ